MAAVVLSLALSVILAATLWLVVGPRFTLHEDARQNDVLNVFAYFGAALPFVFLAVFLLVEKL